MDRFKPTKYDKIQDDETAEAVEQAHTQNSDTKLDEGGASEVVVADIKDAVDKKHTQNTDQKLDEGGVNEVVVADISDAVTHKDLTNNPHTVTSAQVGAYTQAEVNTLVNGAKCIEVTMSGNANNYLFAKSATYAVITRFIFKGTTKLGSPTNIKVIAHVKTAAKTGDVIIYDSTNANAICEVTGISSLVPTIIDLGTLSNLPSGEATFEVQAKSPEEEVYVSGLIIEF